MMKKRINFSGDGGNGDNSQAQPGDLDLDLERENFGGFLEMNDNRFCMTKR